MTCCKKGLCRSGCPTCGRQGRYHVANSPVGLFGILFCVHDRRPPSPLDKVQPENWTEKHTTEILDLLHVLGRLVALEPKQTELLEQICTHPTIDVIQLQKVGALEIPYKNDGLPLRTKNEDQGNLDLV
jgi:hypothetical protein